MIRNKIFLLIAVIVTFFIVLTTFILYFIINSGSGTLYKYRTNAVSEKKSEYDTKDIYVYTSDNLKIYGELLVPEEPKAVIILAHGWDMTHDSLVEICDYLYLNNYATINVDLRSRGNSEGEIKTAGYGESLDIEAFIKYVKEHKPLDKLPIGLLGHSAGSSAVFNTFNDSVKSVVSISGITDYNSTLLENYDVDRLPDKGKFVPFYINLYLQLNGGFFNVPSFDKRIDNFATKGTPILFVHAKEDRFVPIYQSEIFKEELEKQGSNTALIYEVEGDNHFPWFRDDTVLLTLDYDVLDIIVDFFDNVY